MKTNGYTMAVIPAFNEEFTIGSVVLKAMNYVDGVVVIDDGSEDRTSMIAEMAGAKVVKHTKNGGYGAAIQSCFKCALDGNANAMVILDSDGQHDPLYIPHLIEKIYEGADVVVGSRFLNGNSDVPFYRKTGMKVLDAVTNTVSGLGITDTQSGFRAYSRKAIESIKINGSGMSAGSEILIQAKDNNLKIAEVPITCSYDVNDPSTHNPVSHGIDVIMGIVRAMGINRPLTFLGIPGVLMVVSGLIISMWILQGYNAGGFIPFGPTMLTMLLIIVGSLSTFSAIMLYSMGKLVKERGNVERTSE
ncbi:MAG: glycosyltransferase family 2 protein [Halobacteriota archaeon]|nr:glycosyltransferase family 2 protein [Halobacteriota archaeon]